MLNLILIAVLVKVNLACKSAWVATGIYVIFAAIMGLIVGIPVLVIAIAALINTGIAFLYFWLLKKTEDSSTWWVVLIVGFLLIIGISFVRF